ncbi:hypothetical protein NO2_0184 [Candidatus Termititenax persephonae]|uniref:Glycosyltransferase RgtA/B/C/D-like domain-containing protein n=1 Tax=Candidatus Termititenax persephonae TaxID=2218525 RepID=A0A388TES8_9BACT|nr:hypothetical protein NO2_0184 [Candidatus Termititenax persephonae]
MGKLKKVCLLLILLLACAVRLADLGTHFVHLDDAITIIDILRAKHPDYRQELLDIIDNPLNAAYHSRQKTLIKNIYENPQTRFIFDATFYLARFLIVPLTNSNAPLQFLITPFLINDQQNYNTLLFMGRLPSCVFSLLTILLLCFILKKNNHTALLLGVLIGALSLENIIFAKQSYSYAIGCLAAAGLLLLLQHSRQENFFRQHWLTSAGLTTLFVYAHYQLFFLLPAYYLVNFWLKRFSYPEAKKLIYSGLLNLAFGLPALCYILLVRPTAGAAIYNSGLHGEFLFTPDKNIFWFLLRNGFLVLTHTLSPVAADNFFYWIFGGLFTAGFVLGLRKCYKTPEGLFVVFSLLTYLGLVFTQKLTLTPTRNALVYLPLFIYVIAQSLPELKTKTLAYLLSAYTGIFLFFFPSFLRGRQTPLNEKELVKIIEHYQPYLIGEYDNVNAPLLKNIRQKYKYADRVNYLPNRPADFQTIAFLDTYAPLDEQKFQYCQDFWNEKKLSVPPWTNTYAQYEVVYEKISTSSIELEPNNWNSNGTNNLFFYVLKLKSASSFQEK